MDSATAGPRCKGCGRPMVWGETADGKHIPLDPSAPVYRVVNNGFGPRVERVDGQYMVSHFATCREANRFSASNRK